MMDTEKNVAVTKVSDDQGPPAEASFTRRAAGKCAAAETSAALGKMSLESGVHVGLDLP